MILWIISSMIIILFHGIFSYPASSNPSEIKFFGPDIYWRYDCPGNDFYEFHTESRNCEFQCKATPQCTHAVWSRKNNYTCYLKKGPFSKLNLVPTNDTEIMCVNASYVGNRTDPPKQLQLPTKYRWDCTIPECSRYANILRSDNRVNLCDRNGCSPSYFGEMEIIRGLPIRMGPREHICNNQQPWYVNDSLAYGYGALHLTETSDIRTCCVCYELKFNDNQLKDKTMFIQIIDHEEIIMKDAQKADLFIPGSFVYLHCDQQWDDYRSGYQYPVEARSREDCDKYPEGLQDGCLFKFDWLKNVSNPNINYTKVQCPKELIDRSGCYQGSL